jgi:membrane-associated phospholipid phosphatase
VSRLSFYVGFISSLLCILVFADVGGDWTESGWKSFERLLAAPVFSCRSSFWDGPVELLTQLGSFNFLTVLITVCLLSRYFTRHDKITLLALGIGQGLVSSFLKAWYVRPRPGLEYHPLTTEPNYSFPSGHSMSSLCIYGFLAYLLIHKYPKLTAPILLGTTMLVGIIGLTRVYLAVHFPSDVLGGFTAGWPCLFLAIVVHSRWKTAATKSSD